MLKILEFLKRHLYSLVFLLLEVCAVVLLSQSNALQRSVLFRFSTVCQAVVYEGTSSISNYFGLRSTNDALMAQNIELLNRIAILEKTISILDEDSIAIEGVEVPLKYISANVVYNKFSTLHNYIIIDKGTNDGVSEYMGVISSQGVVGTIARVTEHYSVVNTLINADVQISAKIKHNNQLGLTSWSGGRLTRVNLMQIPNHVAPAAGDTVVTSGHSSVFPEGVIVGIIEKAEPNNSTAYCDIDVHLQVDFQSLDYVIITAFEDMDEILQLQNSIDKQ